MPAVTVNVQFPSIFAGKFMTTPSVQPVYVNNAPCIPVNAHALMSGALPGVKVVLLGKSTHLPSMCGCDPSPAFGKFPSMYQPLVGWLLSVVENGNVHRRFAGGEPALFVLGVGEGLLKVIASL